MSADNHPSYSNHLIATVIRHQVTMKPTDKTENEATQLRVFSVYQPPISERLD